MAVTIGGTSYGCSAALERRAYGIARAGRQLADLLTGGGTLPSKYTIAGEVYNVTKINITPNGTTNNQAALSSALGASRSGTPTLVVLPPSDNYYRYSNVLNMSENTYVVGYGAKVLPLQDDLWNWVFANNCGLFGLAMHSTYGAMSRWPERFEAANKLVEGAKNGSIANAANDGWSAAWVFMGAKSNCIMFDVETTGSLTGALRCANSDNVLVENCSAFRTHSDSFHLVKDSSNITARRNRIYDAGDDAISVIQYDDATGIPRNMLIEHNFVKGGRARGLTVVSGQDILFRHNYVEDINLAGYRFGPTGAHSKNDTRRIILEDCQAWRCGRMQNPQAGSGSFAALLSTNEFRCLDVKFVRCRGYAFGGDYYKDDGAVRQTNPYGSGGITFTTTDTLVTTINQSQ